MSGGEGGIRTRETSHPAYALSRRAYSSTLAPLRGRKEADPHVRASNSMQLWRFLCQPAYRPRMETNPVCGLLKSVGSVVAERAGFEPAIRANVYRFSRAAPSTTRPPLLGQKSGYRPMVIIYVQVYCPKFCQASPHCRTFNGASYGVRGPPSYQLVVLIECAPQRCNDSQTKILFLVVKETADGRI